MESKKNNKNTEISLIEQFWYPKYGPGQLWETLVNKEIYEGAKNRVKNLRKFIYFLKDAQYKDFFKYCTKCFVNFDSKIKCIIKIMLLWLLRVLCWIF